MPRDALTIEVPDLSDVTVLPDGVLQDLAARLAECRRTVDARLARVAGEIARRSSWELGHSGLAQRSGLRSPEALLTHLTGVSGRDAREMVTVGAQLTAPAPWLGALTEKVEAGVVSVGQAAAISTGLGSPSADVAADDLADAAMNLVREAGTLPPEKVARLARAARDDLDASGVADREAHLRSQRYLKLTPQPDGMTRVHGLLDPESAALVTDAFDTVTSPRRGGPRFVDLETVAFTAALDADPRTTEQLTHDAFVEMIRIATTADPGRLFGARSPSVRIHVKEADLAGRSGAAWAEGQSTTLSITTVERVMCAEGYLPIIVNPRGTAIDVGRQQRTFTTAQRIALAATWGGYAHPECDRPPSWCEAHHLREWSRGGTTDLAEGILFCKFHHMWVHNTDRHITREGDHYYLHPPPDTDAPPMALRSKSPLRR